MESKPSRYHRRKLSSFSNGFSSKNEYDDVFSGPPSFGARDVSARVVEDYKAIFGSSRASSIPILDLSPPGTGDGSSDYRSSELDYSNIFGGLREEDAGVSYEQVVANGGTRREKSSSPKVRIPSPAGSPLHSAETLKTSSENKVFPSDASFQSFDDKKHFNMSYNVSNTGSKDSRNGTTYITQFHPVPGFTCFIDETTPRKIEADKPKSSVISHLSNKETFGREVKSGYGFSWDVSSANDKLFNKHENNHKSHSSEMRPPSSVPAKIDQDENLKRSGASYSKASNKNASEHAAGDCSPTLYGEELDVNSAAAASAAVLKDAIQKAQESIRIAKELMERKKEGLRSRSSHGTRNSLKVRDRRETIIAHEENRTDDTNAKETSGDVDYVSQLFSGMRRKSGLRSGPRAPIKPISPGNNRTVVPFIETMDKDEPNVMEVHIFLKTLEPQEVIVQKESADEKSHELAYRAGKLNNAKAEKESENRVDQVESANLVCEHEGIVNCSNSQEDEVTKETHTDIYIKEDGEKKLKDSLQNDNDAFGVDGFKENHNDKRLDYVQEQEEIENKQEVSQQDNIIKAIRDLEEEGSRYTPEKICRKVVDDERFEDAFQWTEDENEPKEGMGSECNNKEKDIYMRPDSEWRDKVDEQEIRDKTVKDIPDEKESKQLFEDIDLEGYEQDLTKISAETEHMHIEAEKREVLQEATYEIDYKATVWSPDVSDKNRTKKAFQNEINHINSETCQEVDDSTGKIETCKDFYNFKVGEVEAVKLAYRMREKEHGKIVTFAQNHAEDTLTGNGIKVLFEAFPSEDSPPKFGSTGIKLDKSEFAQRNSDLYSDSNLELGPDMLANESTEKEDAREDNNSNQKEGEKSNTESFDEKERHVERDFGISEGFGMSKAKQKTIEVDDEIKTRQNTKKNEESSHKTIVIEEKEMEIDEVIQTRQSKYVNDENHNKVLVMEEKETKNTVSEVVKEEECLSKIYEENKREREREREKEKIAVERAIREARERAFAEAREKAERAAVERATAEVRHRVMAEAREKFDKDTAATKVSTEKASFKAKLRSERAAVERATAEARERALEKALSQKARAQAERSTSQNMSGPSGDNSMKKSFSSSDLEKNYEANTDLVQRNKANLEKHERIMERAAKALAEKNMRDLLAQKEQAEKNRLAEALDADIKRWSSGKEGNLRALLSTLQYILGPGSGWQPISLTEIITTSAVKKAYRKATLYVHPDKLQQRGASIQQKYICEKVFDLLKAAWTRFNQEEK